MSMPSLPIYAPFDVNGQGQEKVISLDDVFEDFLFNDLCDLDGFDFEEITGSKKEEEKDTGGIDNKRKHVKTIDTQKKDRR
jgi:hypothetical protein